MALAGRVLAKLAAQFGIETENPGFPYIGVIFRLAALLHDVGHCAFSHSAENVTVEPRDEESGLEHSASEPLFGTLRQCLTRWGDHDLIKQLEDVRPRVLDSPARHEELGLALVRYLFHKDTVRNLCTSELNADPRTVAQDVCAVMSGDLDYTERWISEADALFALIPKGDRDLRFIGRVDRKPFRADLMQILHSLVSGTLDVDRMDYLIRDSYYCGVPYGRCDVELLIGNLSIGGVDGRLDLFLKRKAVDCLDDLLWSRYQLFVQVLNHKANVAMNTLLSRAIADAINDSVLDRPVSLEQYLLFTDDQVMATVTSHCLRGKLKHKSYAKTLVDRRLPLHLGSLDDPGSEPARQKALRDRASQAGLQTDQLFVGTAESILLKPGRFPTILDWNRAAGRYDLYNFKDFSHFSNKGIPSRKRVLHYYADRQHVRGS